MASDIGMDSCEFVADSPSAVRGTGKKSWDELRQSVRDTNKLLSALANRVPSTFTFRTEQTDAGPITRLYFLGIPPKSRDNTLLYVDVPSEPQDMVPSLPWKHLLDSFQPGLHTSQLSREEQLLRERKRVGSFGITSYDIVENEGKIVFPACNNLFWCEDPCLNSDESVLPYGVPNGCLGARLDPKICSHNSDLVAFISSGDVWVANIRTGQQQQLTCSHDRVSPATSNASPYSAGVPSFVVQEEFDRYTGYWWEPQARDNHTYPHTYRILFEEVDESGVEILRVFSPTSEDGGVDEYRYPRAGTANARSTLKIVEFTIGSDGMFDGHLVERHVGDESMSAYFPWMEYIVRAGWTPDSKFVYVEMMDRQQSRLQLVLIPVECFTPSHTEMEDEGVVTYTNGSHPPIQVIYEDMSEIWTNVHDILYFFPQESENEISFLWSSEKSGYRHLYKITSRFQTRDDQYVPLSAVDLMDRDESVVYAKVVKEVTLTSGEWEVAGKQVWVDEKRKLVYFTGYKDTCLESHVYVVSYLYPKDPQRLTEANFSHNVSFNSDCSAFVTVYSSVTETSMSSVHKINHSKLGQISTHNLGYLVGPSVCPDYHAPELFQFQTHAGHTSYGMFYKPHDFRPDVKYPTVLFVYGGPQVQLVTNSFKGLKFLRLHTLASQGYVVVVVDGRGSCHRGVQYESHIKNRLGMVEIDDQVEGLQWLASRVDFIDLRRVAIHGWSYGGYLSLMGLAQRSDVFKLAIAGAPVVNWQLYDTGYTERYMGLPEDNRQAYRASSVLNFVETFPDEENRLLIIHGLIDENVHFHHTSHLISALIRHCKPYRLQVYPNERHGIRSHEASEHFKTMILSFLQQYL
ncbi:hypothetical protein ScPMuIL_002507 [Solemya velum]